MTNSTQFKVKEASADQRLQTYKNTCTTWGRGLSLEKYFEREKILSSVEFGQNNLQVWVLVNSLDEDEEVLAHCETYKRPVYYKLEDGEVKLGKIYSICSVFTPELQRGKGYASKLFNLLPSKLNDSFGAALYSDIGTFYERFGFYPYSSSEYQFTTEQSVVEDGQVELLNENQIKELSEVECQKLESRLRAESDPSFLIKPDYTCFNWHWARAKYYASQKNGPQDFYWGCKYNDSILIWTIDFSNNYLKVIHSNNANTFVISKAIQYAKQLNLGKVVLWEEKELDFGKLQSKIVKREDSLPYMKFNDEKLDNKVKWVYNEAYGWV